MSNKAFRPAVANRVDNIGQYDVIYLDITRFISRSKSRKTNVVSDIQTAIIEELAKAFPEYVDAEEVYLPDALYRVSHATAGKFIIIIDEWDALFREAKDDLLEATIAGNCEKVADTLEKTHESVASVLEYNNEASLSSAIPSSG